MYYIPRYFWFSFVLCPSDTCIRHGVDPDDDMTPSYPQIHD